MVSWALFFVAAVLSCSRGTKAYPLYPDTSLVPQADLYQKMIVEEGTPADFGENRQGKDLYAYPIPQNVAAENWSKGKESLQPEKINNMVDDLKAAVLKLAAMDRLRSQGFLRSDPSLLKPNKRACFWKYCVTN